MIIRVTMKDPDTLLDAVYDAVDVSIKEMSGLSEKDRLALRRSRAEEAYEAASKWFKYGEYLTIEIDTERDTATVIQERD